MGMYGTLVQVSNQEFDKLSDNEDLVADIFNRADDSDEAENTATVPKFLNLEKSWAAFEVLFQETAPRGGRGLEAIVLGSKPIGDDIGYGPAQYLEPDTVVVLSSYLEKLPVASLSSYIKSGKLAAKEVHGNWGEDDEKELLERFEQLKSFYKYAASNRNYILAAVR
jgi:hypothetical protein